MAVKKKGLGKGLDSLIPAGNSAKTVSKSSEMVSQSSEVSEKGEKMVKINMVEPNRNQPRRNFEEDSLLELADSIKQHGVLSPLWVHEVKIGKDSYYEIIAGERRWRAAKKAGLK